MNPPKGDYAEKYRLKMYTWIEGGMIRQKLQREFEERNSVIGGHLAKLNEWVINTQDKAIEGALIELGWLPPLKRKCVRVECGQCNHRPVCGHMNRFDAEECCPYFE